LNNTNRINNWDLIDLTAPRIIGDYLLDKDKSLLINLAKSKSLWERRIAVLSTFQFIKYNQYDFSLEISKILLNDHHDLIHKAVGWMLREIGKRNLSVEEKFLKAHYSKMPRTMLRYAIEKFPEKKRKGYLQKK
jgi:3-methyladenine DNA glycosylase AlkD